LDEENGKVGVHTYIIPGFLSWGGEFFRLDERLLDVWLKGSLRSPW
jgi:hypothetical protein